MPPSAHYVVRTYFTASMSLHCTIAPEPDQGKLPSSSHVVCLYHLVETHKPFRFMARHSLYSDCPFLPGQLQCTTTVHAKIVHGVVDILVNGI